MQHEMSKLVACVNKMPRSQSSTVAITQPDGSVRYASISSQILKLVLPPSEGSLSSTMARSEGTSSLNLIPEFNLNPRDVFSYARTILDQPVISVIGVYIWC